MAMQGPGTLLGDSGNALGLEDGVAECYSPHLGFDSVHALGEVGRAV